MTDEEVLNLRIGDEVVIVKTARGWRGWISPLDTRVGKTGRVMDINKESTDRNYGSYYIRVLVPGEDAPAYYAGDSFRGYNYPNFILGKVENRTPETEITL